MTAGDNQVPRLSGTAIAVRVLVGVLGLPALAFWALVAFLVFAVRCDDDCSDFNQQSWQYAGQGIFVSVVILIAIIGFAASFTRRWRRAWSAVALAVVVCVFVWIVWIGTIGQR